MTNLENDPKAQELRAEMSVVMEKQLDLCMTIDNYAVLNLCDKERIPKLKEICNQDYNSKNDFWLNVNFDEFYNTIDERIINAEAIKTERDAKIEELNKQISVLEEKLDYSDPTESYSSITDVPEIKQREIDYFLYNQYTRIIRDCINQNEGLDIYVSKIVSTEPISLEEDVFFLNSRERINTCNADIKEMENYCDSFDTLCAETGRIEPYWQGVIKLQSSFDDVCTKTGKLCEYTFGK